MTVKELRAQTGLSQSQFAARFQIPVRTLQHWEQGRQDPPAYVVAMIEQILTLSAEVPARWIPVTERLPKSCDNVLVSVKNFDQSLIGWYDADWEGWFVEEGLSERKDLTVTHWQEKPRPAKEG